MSSKMQTPNQALTLLEQGNLAISQRPLGGHARKNGQGIECRVVEDHGVQQNFLVMQSVTCCSEPRNCAVPPSGTDGGPNHCCLDLSLIHI